MGIVNLKAMKNLLLLLMTLSSFITFGQGEDNIWLTPYGAPWGNTQTKGLSFNNIVNGLPTKTTVTTGVANVLAGISLDGIILDH